MGHDDRNARDANPSGPPAPRQFGEYEVQRYLGSGAFGHTFEVADPEGQRCAIKWLREDPAASGAERFANEAWALRQLQHPNIPMFIGEGEASGRPYLVMSLARGESLAEHLRRQMEEGGSMSQLRLVTLLVQILDALAHMHERGIVHRDIKTDNVIANDSLSQVTVVDLGVCKGRGQPTDAATFWNAGASRFSPPSKLKYPTEVNPTHDVFSVGVIGYLFLTNRYPWEVPSGQSHGDLEDLMRGVAAVPIHRINLQVSKGLSEFVMELLVIDDAKRPGARDAANRLLALQKQLARQFATKGPAIDSMPKRPRVVRDPIHKDIAMSEYEWEVLRTPQMQRLRWVHQLGGASFVYPGAEHSRLSHALGTMKVADEILRRMEERTGTAFEPEEKVLARLYALLHDVTHVAFGHTLEDELGLYVRHDRNDARIHRLVMHDKSELAELLRSTEYGQVVQAHLDPNSTVAKHSWLQDLIEAPCGADVLDYIDRDAHFCGLDHKVDSAVFRRFAISTQAAVDKRERHMLAQLYGRSGFRLDADFALESILRERFGLFLKVYTHQAKVAVGAMIGRAVRAAADAPTEERLSERRLEWMGDAELLVWLRDAGPALARDLGRRVFRRDLYKPAFRARALGPGELDERAYHLRQSRLQSLGLFDPARRGRLEADIAQKAKVRPGDVILYCPQRAPGLQRIRQYIAPTPGREELRDEAHDMHSEMYQRHLRLWEVYALVAPELEPNKRNAIGEEAEEVLGLQNQIRTDRRQLLLGFIDG